jgi:glycosyltransferase involved in cell wall biosynthesis
MEHITLHHKFIHHKCCVLIPTYNNAASIKEVINGVLEFTSNIVVVNDGSTDNTAKLLEDYPDLQIVHHPKNMGKGMALRTGFKAAYKSGYQYAISIDSDGQHYPDDLHLFIDQIEIHPNAIIIGARNMDQPNVPGKSTVGNRASSFWFWVVTGIKLSDTQSGYRLYPLAPLNSIYFITRKYEFEIEVMVRASWKGVEVLSIPVKVFYPPADERVTHFRPFKDVTRITLLNIIFVLLSAFWFTPIRLIKNFSFRESKKKLYDHTVGSPDSITKKSLSMGFGIFMGITPFWGYQIWLALGLAHLLKLNKVIVAIFSNISIPPFIPFILYGSYYAGAKMLGKSTDLAFSSDLSVSDVWNYLQPYLYGSFLLAFIAGAGVSIVAYALLHLVAKFSVKK